MPYKDPEVARKHAAKRQKTYRAKHPEKTEAALEEWRKNNHARVRAINKRAVMKHKHGITWDQFEEMLKAQAGVCAICGKTDGEGKRLHIDHCHTNGHIRGLLCGKCNRMLGMAEDSVYTLRRAIDYLES